MSKKYEIKKTQAIVLIAFYAALVASTTLFTSVQYTQGGYFNLGDVAVMLLAALTPFRHAIIASTLGSMIADVLAGAIQYAVFTGIIKGLMVFIIYLLRNWLSSKLYFIPFVLSSLIMLLGYGLVDGLIFGGYTIVASIIVNLTQAALGSVLTSLIYPFSKNLRTFLKD